MTGLGTQITDAFEETPGESPAPVSSQLRAIVPAPADTDVNQLEQVAARHRVLLVRTSAVIAVTTLISVGGALLLHALLGGVVVLGLWFPGTVHAAKRGRSLAGLPDAGGSVGGYMILGVGPSENASPFPTPPDLGGSTAGLASILPPLPQLPERPGTTGMVMAMSPVPTAEPLPVATLNPPEITAPSPAPAAAPAVPTAGPANPGPSIAGDAAQPGNPARGTGFGQGGGDEDRPFSLVRGDGGTGTGGGGLGSGAGGGWGSGLNRGMSLGDRPAQQLNQSSAAVSLTLPMKYQVRPPEKDVTLAITVGADGAIKAVRVQESCGISEVDELVRAFYQATYRSSPEYRAGKPVESVQTLHYVFHDL